VGKEEASRGEKKERKRRGKETLGGEETLEEKE